ncbi:prefoldin subunit alpha [Candidatus Bathyarchaeota archaeon]|nr:prefoldin subunit alpha [Candidatus Bathyarchaeota archaeon]
MEKNKREDELRRINIELRLLEQTAEAIQSRIDMINAVITDLTYANMALEGLEKEKENSELLVPIGGNSFIKAKLENPDKLIVGMGAGISVEKTMQEAKEIIKRRLDNTEKTRQSLQQQLAQVAEKISEDRERFESLVAEMRKEQPSQNV